MSLERTGSDEAVGIEHWLAKSAKPKPGEVCGGVETCVVIGGGESGIGDGGGDGMWCEGGVAGFGEGGAVD